MNTQQCVALYNYLPPPPPPPPPLICKHRYKYKLQALVYDILPSTTAVFSYAIGSRKLSANEQFFVVLKQQ